MANKIDYQRLFEYQKSKNKFKVSDWDWLLVGIDPSGNISSGYGHIGFCVGGVKFNHLTHQLELQILETQTISLKKIKIADNQKLATHLDHWKRIMIDLNQEKNLTIICEKYIEYQNQVNQFKEPETQYYVKYVEQWCLEQHIPFFCPLAAQHKIRFSDQVLNYQGLSPKLFGDKHSQDASRMVLYNFMFKLDKEQIIKRKEGK